MSSKESTPWVEKYRPKSLTEVSHQTEVVSTLQNAVETNRLPHLLLYGPPGTGKTSVALALCRTLWEPSQLKRRVLELNASDERGISVVRDKIKHFAALAVGNSGPSNKNYFSDQGKGKSDDETKKDEDVKRYPNPPFKIIILDEADAVTHDAQAALRRIIEAHSKITRFILICNYVTRIIEPLASRCAKFRFQPLPPTSMKNRLQFIAHEEQCEFSLDGEEKILDEILELSQGDMRRAVTCLQSAHVLSGGEAGGNGFIQKDNIAEMVGLPPSTVILSILEILQNPKSCFDDMEKAVSDVMLEGYSAQHIIGALLTEIIELDKKTLSDLHKAKIAIKIAEVDKNLIDGADELLQLLMVCSLIFRCYKNA